MRAGDKSLLGNSQAQHLQITCFPRHELVTYYKSQHRRVTFRHSEMLFETIHLLPRKRRMG